jgi:hypothetical protein
VDWEQPLARAGLVGKGVFYGLVGLLALKLALGGDGRATMRPGALQELAGTTFGTVLLILLALGFGAYAIWRFVQIAQTDQWGKRIAFVARALVYSGLTYSTVKILMGGHQQSQNRKAHKTTAAVLAWPAGRELVIAGALVFVGVGLWQLYSGISLRFEQKWRGGSTWGSRAGVVGHVARFVVFSLIGIFAIKAAADYNSQDAVGLDGALQKLAHASYGSALLGLTAAGLLAYGLFCFVDARYRDVTR